MKNNIVFVLMSLLCYNSQGLFGSQTSSAENEGEKQFLHELYTHFGAELGKKGRVWQDKLSDGTVYAIGLDGGCEWEMVKALGKLHYGDHCNYRNRLQSFYNNEGAYYIQKDCAKICPRDLNRYIDSLNNLRWLYTDASKGKCQDIDLSCCKDRVDALKKSWDRDRGCSINSIHKKAFKKYEKYMELYGVKPDDMPEYYGQKWWKFAKKLADKHEMIEREIIEVEKTIKDIMLKKYKERQCCISQSEVDEQHEILKRERDKNKSWFLTKAYNLFSKVINIFRR